MVQAACRRAAGYAERMRTMILVAAALYGCSHGATTTYITIGSDAIGTVRALAHTLATDDHARLDVLEVGDEAAIVAIDERELPALSERMHADFDRCGGFMRHDSLEDARAEIVKDKRQIEYTLDRDAIVRTLLPALDEGRILATIGELSAMPNRYYQSTNGAAASVWLRDRWRSFSTRADVTVELVDHGWAQQSVVLTIPGSSRASEIIVLGGHLDSIAPGGVKSNAPGADDDASGIATLTEIARVLLAGDFRPARTIKFIAYAAEEVGLRGSQAIVKAFQKDRIDVVGALQLDMTNYQGSERDIWLMKDFTSAAQNGFVIQLIEAYTGATYGLDACGYACSDHASWYRAGVPASMPFESRTAQRNKSIHTKGDTLEQSGNNAAHALKFARLGAAYAIELAKGELGGAAIASEPQASHGWRNLAIALGLALAAFGIARSATKT